MIQETLSGALEGCVWHAEVGKERERQQDSVRVSNLDRVTVG